MLSTIARKKGFFGPVGISLILSRSVMTGYLLSTYSIFGSNVEQAFVSSNP